MTQEEIKVQELLKPRVIVDNKWPGCPFEVDDILVRERDAYHFNGDWRGMVPYTEVDPFPYLMRPLNWWEERDESKMPEYVKNKHGVIKVERHFSMYSLNISNEPLGVDTHFTYGDKQSSNYAFYEPATSAEYTAYITAIAKIDPFND